MEQERIPTVTVETPIINDPEFTKVPVNDTEDKMFLLSMQEASRYLKGGKVRRCQPTEYAIACYEAAMGKEWDKSSWREEYWGNCVWWLRTPGAFPGSATGVQENGRIGYMGYNHLDNTAYDFMWGIRPAMWIDLTP